jgi:phytoene synthase
MSADFPLDGDRAIALAYAATATRQAFGVLLRFDLTLGNVLRSVREPALAQLRLGWWRDQLQAVPELGRSHDPLTVALQSLIDGHDVIQGDLVAVVNGWETLLADFPLSTQHLEEHGRLRGGGVFRAAASIAGLESTAHVTEAGSIWALADLARHVSDMETALRAEHCARILGEHARHLPRKLSTFAILARFAERDLTRMPEHRTASGSPFRMLHALGFVAFRR